jgi:hypothetical protein
MDQPKSPSVIPGSPEADLKQTIHPKKSIPLSIFKSNDNELQGNYMTSEGKRKTKKGRRRLRTQELASDSDSDRGTLRLPGTFIIH